MSQKINYRKDVAGVKPNNSCYKLEQLDFELWSKTILQKDDNSYTCENHTNLFKMLLGLSQ